MKTKALISFAVTAKLTCVFVFVYAKSRFSHDPIHIILLNFISFVLQEASLDSLAAGAPRQTGSMVAHHDDAVTRMKNIELIELGRYRIKPWYFSPYPQVTHSTINPGTSQPLEAFVV